MKDDLIMFEELQEEMELDEIIESEIDELKAEYHENLILLENLMKEVTNQIENKSPNLIKIKELING